MTNQKHDFDQIADEAIPSPAGTDGERPPSSNNGGHFAALPQNHVTGPANLGLLSELEKPATLGERPQNDRGSDEAPNPSDQPSRTARASRAVKTSPELGKWMATNFKFDWYQATIPHPNGSGRCGAVGGQEEKDAIARLYAWAGDVGFTLAGVKHGHCGYRTEVGLLDSVGGKPKGHVWSGSMSDAMPQLVLTGGCHADAMAFRRPSAGFEGHRVSRMDLAADFTAPGLWDALHKIAQAQVQAPKNDPGSDKATPPRNDPGPDPAPKPGKKRRSRGKVLPLTYEGGAETGRTFYLGSKHSAVFIRVYEKGLQMRHKRRNPDPDADPNWVRIEVLFRGDRRAVALGEATIPGALSSSAMVRKFLARTAALICGKELGEIGKVTLPQDPRGGSATLEAKVDNATRQAGPSITRLAVVRLVDRLHNGDWAAAQLTQSQIEAETVAIFRAGLRDFGTVERTMGQLQVVEVQTRESRAMAFAAVSVEAAHRELRARLRAAEVVAGLVPAEDEDGRLSQIGKDACEYESALGEHLQREETAAAMGARAAQGDQP